METELIGVLKQPSVGSETLLEGEMPRPEKRPFGLALDVLRGFVVGSYGAITYAVGTAMYKMQEDVFESPFQIRSAAGSAAMIQYLVSSAEVDQTLQETNARLNELRHLPRDWYAHGAKQITETAVVQAKLLVFSLSEWHHGILGVRIRPQGVIPLPDGGVELAWHGSRGKLEVLISPNNELDYVVEVEKGPLPLYEDGATSINRVPILLNRIL